MCQPTEEFKFCTCEGEEVRTDELNVYVWSLSRYLGEKQTKIKGKIKRPAEDLGKGITVDEVVNKLSGNNCFDFEYSPVERDTVHVSINDSQKGYQYFRVIFRDGKWQPGGNPAFVSITSLLHHGLIETKTGNG